MLTPLCLENFSISMWANSDVDLQCRCKHAGCHVRTVRDVSVGSAEALTLMWGNLISLKSQIEHSPLDGIASLTDTNTPTLNVEAYGEDIAILGDGDGVRHVAGNAVHVTLAVVAGPVAEDALFLSRLKQIKRDP